MKKYLCLLIAVILVAVARHPAHAALAEAPIVIAYPGGRQEDTEERAMVDKYSTLLPVNVVQRYIYEPLVVDSSSGRVYIDFAKPPFRLESERLDEMLKNGVRLNFSVKMIDGKAYMDVAGLEKLLGIKVSLKETSGRLEIETGQTYAKAERQLNKPRQPQVFTGKINLVWDHIGRESPDLSRQDAVLGLDVISPTWFAVVNEDGLVVNKADMKYVRDAHDKNYKVWALITNSFDRELTRKILADEKAQDNIIRQVAVYASLYDLDGINIDFENIYDTDRERLTAFVGKLTAALKEQNITVSMDVTVPSKTPYWSSCYDRKALGQIVDYIMVMTYDEHWRESPVSGPVASLGWVERGLSASLAYVPPEKLLMGIPFYTREWEETLEAGKVKVKARTMSMAQAARAIMDNNGTLEWLEDKGLYYSEYFIDGKRYRIWLEEEKSIALKAGLVEKYGLAGTASWRKGFEKPQIWEVLRASLKKPELQEERLVSTETVKEPKRRIEKGKSGFLLRLFK